MVRTKPISGLRRKQPREISSNTFPLQAPTLVMLGLVGMFGAIALSWLLGENHISSLFAQWHWWQQNPPEWIKAPKLENQYYLLIPAIVLFLVAQIIMKLSPQPKKWSRAVVIGILLALTSRYLLWRSLTTLNLSNPVQGIFSVGLWLMELLTISLGMIELYLMLGFKDRKPEADKNSEAVIAGVYNPSVDIFIPTYDEAAFILKRTIIGCQKLEYYNKNIYLLDDTKRPEIKQLAQELGCNYLTRQDNHHAKAGNLNQAIAQTKGELIVVFDADFIPTRNFLTRTVGFFQNQKVGLLQTPQSFYNPDPIAKNLGLEDVLTPEEEIFYRQAQPTKDGAGSVLCSGTSFVMRRTALEEVGYFVTNSLCEDYFTGIKISAKGYQLVYLDEKLSAGLAAESMSAHIIQRLRWCRGTLQGFFIEANPFKIPGLKFRQRLGHIQGLFFWFTCIPRLFFLIIPLLMVCGIYPIIVSAQDALYVFLPYFIVQLSVFSWLNLKARSALLSDIYSLVPCFPLAVTVIQVMLNPFSKERFKVTPKGISSYKYSFNWSLALPLVIILGATVVGTWLSLLTPVGNGNVNVGLIWNFYNLLTVTVALLSLLEPPKPNPYDWFYRRRSVEINTGDQAVVGITQKISEAGAIIWLRKPQDKSAVKINQKITLEILQEGLILEARITSIDYSGKFTKIEVAFKPMALPEYKELVDLLYCRPGQWQNKETPGELESLWLMLKLLLRPFQLLRKNVKYGTEVY